jgi:hypothetical protein
MLRRGRRAGLLPVKFSKVYQFPEQMSRANLMSGCFHVKESKGKKARHEAKLYRKFDPENTESMDKLKKQLLIRSCLIINTSYLYINLLYDNLLQI